MDGYFPSETPGMYVCMYACVHACRTACCVATKRTVSYHTYRATFSIRMYGLGARQLHAVSNTDESVLVASSQQYPSTLQVSIWMGSYFLLLLDYEYLKYNLIVTRGCMFVVVCVLVLSTYPVGIQHNHCRFLPMAQFSTTCFGVYARYIVFVCARH